MRKMLYTIWFLGSLLHVGCTKDNYIDTGISNGRYHGNLMQYMGSNSYPQKAVRYRLPHVEPTESYGFLRVKILSTKRLRSLVSRIIRFVGICWNPVINGWLISTRSGVVKCC